jgi:DNA-binding transcriptional MerR regulator
MEYRVEQLAEATGVRVDTVRFYQGKGLIPPPERRGRIAIYGQEHLEQLRRVRELLDQGFRLAQIETLLAPSNSARSPSSGGTGEGALLRELVSNRVGRRTLTREELARESGVPAPLIQAIEAAGLMEPVEVGGQERFDEADLEMARAGLEIIGAGFPLNELLRIAMSHAAHVGEVTDSAIDLFDEHVRRNGPSAGNDQAIAEIFRALIPHVTRLVALHFQRTLVNRALTRLRRSGEESELEFAVAVAESGQLEVAWRA